MLYRVLLAPLFLSTVAACSNGGDSTPSTALGAAATGCGVRAAAQVDGSCLPVGPADPENSAAFSWSTDGWGLVANHAEGCSRTERSSLGAAECVPVGDCDAPFPPADADIVVSRKRTGANVVSDLQAALDQAPRGAVIAVDSGEWGSNRITRNVTVVGRCPHETTVGNGKNNVFYVEGADVVLRNMTLASSSSTIAVNGGSVIGEDLVLTKSHVAIGSVGAKSSVTLRRSAILGIGKESKAVLVAQGGTAVIEDTDMRDLESGLMVSDPGSTATLRRVIVSTTGYSPTASVIAANAEGHATIEESLVRAQTSVLVAVHPDLGTLGSKTKRSGSMVIRSSVLEQIDELEGRAAVIADSGDLTLGDVTLRHRSGIGVHVYGNDDATLTVERVAVIGDPKVSAIRMGIMGDSAKIVARGLAIPWAQGVGVGIERGTLDLRESFIANVSAREGSGEGILVSQSNATVVDVELADNERAGLIGIGGSEITGERLYVHGVVENPEVDARAAVFAFSTNATFDGCFFEDHGEGVVAANGSVVVRASSFFGQNVALRAMYGMEIADPASEKIPNTISVGSDCTFTQTATKTSLETLPEPAVKLPSWE